MGVYERMGVRPVINARGMNTMAGGSLMPRQVLEAMAEAANGFVDMGQLNERAGQRIAGMIGVEAAHVTSGSAGGLLLAAAACIAGEDPDKIMRLPNTEGMRNEIIIENCRRIRYDQALRTAGARLVEVGTEEDCSEAEIEAAISDRTAAIIHIESPPLRGKGVPLERMVEIAHGHGLPLIVDAASTLPPTSHLTRWTSEGADLVIYSGGKGIRGPQVSGLLLGRADLIRAAAANGAPNGAIGRPCKVSKEDIVGLVTAIELFLQTDWRIEWQRHLEEAREIVDALEGLPGVEAVIEDDESVFTSPTVVVTISEEKTGLTAAGVEAALQAGEPPIMVRAAYGGLVVDPHNLRGDEVSVVARRLQEELSKVAVEA